MNRDHQNEFNIEPIWPTTVDQLPGHKKAELLAIKGGYKKKIDIFVRRYWPGLAEFHDYYNNWDSCFLKCKFTVNCLP